MPWNRTVLSSHARSTLWSVLVLSLVLASCRPLFCREVAGMVLAVTGSTTPALQPNDRVRIGQTVGTAAQSKADLMLLPGTLVALDPETKVKIADLHFAKNGDETIHPVTARNVRLRLQAGTLRGVVGPSQTRSRLIVETRLGTIVAGAGRTFETRTDGKTVWIMCLREPVHFAPADGSARIEIQTGYFLQWPGPPASPLAVAQADREAQAALVALLHHERDLLQLEEEKGHSFIPWQE